MSLWFCKDHGLYGPEGCCPSCGRKGEYATVADGSLGGSFIQQMNVSENPEIVALRARLAPVEAERDALFKINGDLARLLDVEKQAESERDALRATVAKMGEALEPLTGMTALVLKLKEALEAAQGFANRAGYFLGGIDPVLALVPSDLADCVVITKAELTALREAGRKGEYPLTTRKP